MRIRHTRPEQHWSHLLMFFITLKTAALTNNEEIQALLGGSTSFNFKDTKNITVTLAEWSRCPDEKVFVYSPDHGLNIFNDSYIGRLSAKTNEIFSINLEKLQESDFVTYCYKLTTFPNGSLQGQIKLVKKTPTENCLPFILIISVGCGAGFLTLCGIIIGVVCYKKRRRNPANTADTRGRNNPKSSCTQSEDDDLDYLNIP